MNHASWRGKADHPSTPLPQVDPELDDMPFLYETIPEDAEDAVFMDDTVVMEEPQHDLDMTVGIPLPVVSATAPSAGPARPRQKKSYVSSGFVELSKLAVIMQRVLTAL